MHSTLELIRRAAYRAALSRDIALRRAQSAAAMIRAAKPSGLVVPAAGVMAIGAAGGAALLAALPPTFLV